MLDNLLPSAFADDTLEIYELRRESAYMDKTKDFMSRRDQRRQS